MDQIIVIGRCMERYLRSHGLQACSITNIPNWSDGERIRPLPRGDNEFLKQQNLLDRFVVMYSGNHGVVHEYEALVALIRETRAVPQICFCFVGEGAWKHKLMETAKAESWQHVVFLPYQPNAALQSSLSAADVHLVSLRAEMAGLSIPSKIYGVLAAGRPVMFIGPPDSEAAAIVREAACGCVVEPGDTQGAARALYTWCHDRALVEKQGAAARRYFEPRFNRTIATERFQQVLHRVAIDSSTHPAPLRTVSPPTRSQSR